MKTLKATSFWENKKIQFLFKSTLDLSLDTIRLKTTVALYGAVIYLPSLVFRYMSHKFGLYESE